MRRYPGRSSIAPSGRPQGVWTRAAILGLAALALAAPAVGNEPDGRVPLPMPPAPANARILDGADPGTPMERMILVLRPGPAARAGLDRFLEAVQDPRSPDYHRWLDPAAFGARFGAAPAAVDRVAGWLRDQGFAVEPPPRGRLALVFSGTAAQVGQAFRTAIARCAWGGNEFLAATVPPSVPAELADAVEGLVRPAPAQPRHGLREPLPARRGLTLFRLHLLAPGDFAVIYNTRPLLDRGVDGTGTAVAVLSRYRLGESGPATFQWLYGLPFRPFRTLVDGPDPGDPDVDGEAEAAMQVEWAGAAAPGAEVRLVVAGGTAVTDGCDLAALRAVDQDLAPVLVAGFGACERDLGPAGLAFYRNLWDQAAAQGITVVVAAGDAGAAGCGGAPGAAVNGVAATRSNVAVGGTGFAEGTGGLWRWWSGRGGASATGYIPEWSWNDSGTALAWLGGTTTGGGASAHTAKPAWQAAPGVPADGRRDLPDVALAASLANGYLIQAGGVPDLAGGTACAAAAFGGLMALVVQRTGGRLGNPGPVLYRLGAEQYGGSGAAVFHDVQAGNNTVPGTPGYPCGPGYDQATGLGSVDAAALAEAWPRAAGRPQGTVENAASPLAKDAPP